MRFQKYAEQERQQAFNKKIKLSRVEYDGEKDLFLDTFASEDTRDAYCRSINFAEDYAATLDKSLLEFTPAEADDFIYSLTERSPASVRRDVAAVLRCAAQAAWLHMCKFLLYLNHIIVPLPCPPSRTVIKTCTHSV